MEININSPSYFSKQFGVDDDVYWMCSNIRKYMKDRKYSEIIDIIGICPIVAPDEIIAAGKFKETTQYHLASRFISVSRHIDFTRYANALIEERKKLIIGNVLKSVKAVKSKGKIDYARFEQDLLDFVGYERSDILGRYIT